MVFEKKYKKDLPVIMNACERRVTDLLVPVIPTDSEIETCLCEVLAKRGIQMKPLSSNAGLPMGDMNAMNAMNSMNAPSYMNAPPVAPIFTPPAPQNNTYFPPPPPGAPDAPGAPGATSLFPTLLLVFLKYTLPL